MADRQLVLAFFPDEPAADNAAAALKDSGIAHGDAIGILALDSHGKLKQDKVGARSTGKGAAIGGVLFLLGPAVLGVGVIGGTAAGALHHKNLGLSRCRQGAPHRRTERGQGSGRCDGPQRHRARDLRPTDPARRHVRVPRAHRRSPADCGSGHLGSLIDKAASGAPPIIRPPTPPHRRGTAFPIWNSPQASSTVCGWASSPELGYLTPAARHTGMPIHFLRRSGARPPRPRSDRMGRGARSAGRAQ